jgi:hypothetical protein
MVGTTQVRTTDPPVGRAIEGERVGGASAAALPTALAAMLLLVASSSDGAFALRDWGPLAVFCLVALAAARVFPVSRPALAMAGAAWAYALWSVLSVTWAQVPGDAIVGGARNALYAALVSLPLLTVPTRRWAVRLGLGLTAGLGVLVIGTLVALHADPARHFLAGRLDDPVGYRNGTAALFALAFWPLLCVAARRASHVLLRASCFALAVGALGLAFLTQSRGVLIGFAGGGLVAVALGPDRLRRVWLALLVVAGLAVESHPLLAPFDAFLATNATSPAAVDRATSALTALAAVGFAIALALALLDGGLRVSPSAARTMRRLAGGLLVVVTLAAVVIGVGRAGNPVTLLRDKVAEFKQLDAPAPGETRLGSTGGQRYDLWRIALDEFRSAPLTGVGEGSYEPGYYAERRTDRNLDTPHSLVMQLLAETGLIGFGLVAAMLGAAALALARGWRAATPDERRTASALAAASAVMLTQSAVDWLWLIPGLIGLALLSLGLAVAIVARPREAVELRARATLPVRALPVLAALLVVSLVLSDLYVRTARAETTATSAHRYSLARTAGRLDPFSVTPRYLEAGALEEEGRRAAARAKLLGTLDLEPRSFVTLGLLGDLETRAGHRAAAKAYYRRALAANPRDTGLQQLAR